MKVAWMGMIAAAALLAAGTANADQALAQKSGCMACHAVDKKVVGPAFKDVAAKYKGDAGAAAKLVDKVKKGGSGAWGQIPMPPNASVKDEDIKKLVSWVLATK